MLARSFVMVLVFGFVGPVHGQDLAGAGQPAAEGVRELAREIGLRVEQIRGLEFLRPVEVRRVDEAAAREHFKKRLERLWPPLEVRLDERVYMQLGLLPEGTELLKGLLELLEEQAWGYYDPQSDTFFILDRVPPASAPILIAHELTHALDDQHFGIDARLEQLRDDEDRETAFAAVVEGSGTLVMTVFMVEEMRAGRMDREAVEQIERSEAGRARKLEAAPPLLRRSLLAPYVLGFRFLMRGDLHGLSGGAWKQDLNHAFQDPPASSEQILHPEKYWDTAAYDAPQRLALPDQSASPGEGWSLARSGTLGELSLALLVGSQGPELGTPDVGAPEQWTNAAASGLAGDGYQLYTNGTESLTLLATLWDTPSDAAEFRDALERLPSWSVLTRDRAVVIVAGDLPSNAAGLGADALAAILEDAPGP